MLAVLVGDGPVVLFVVGGRVEVLSMVAWAVLVVGSAEDGEVGKGKGKGVPSQEYCCC